MFLIESRPASEVIRSVMAGQPQWGSAEVYRFILENFSEDWFLTVTPSLRGNDNRLYHRVRSIFSQA